MTDYKKIYERLEQTYPQIARRLNPEPVLKDFSQLHQIIESFSDVTGISIDDIRHNKNDSRLLFIAVVTRMADPLFYQFDSYAPYKLIFSIAVLLDLEKGKILYSFKKIKNYLQVYPAFKCQVNEIYQEILRR